MSTSKRIKNIEEYKKMYEKMVRYPAVKEQIPKIPVDYNLENFKLDLVYNEKEEISTVKVKEMKIERSEKILKKVVREQELNAKESSSSTYTKPQLNNSLRKLLTIKVNIAIFLRYLLIVALLTPSLLIFLIVLPFWFYNIISYTILFWTFIITTICSAFVIPYYYYHAIHFFREQKKKFQLKSYFFEHVLKDISTLFNVIKY